MIFANLRHCLKQLIDVSEVCDFEVRMNSNLLVYEDS